MIRWTCPNGCAAVLGPSRPVRDAVVRVCLSCSQGQLRLVQRLPIAKLNEKAKKEEKKTAKRAVARTEREKEAEARRLIKQQAGEEAQRRREREKLSDAQAKVTDFHVSSNGHHRVSSDKLVEAMRHYRVFRKASPDARITLTCVRHGELYTAYFHGRTHVGWETVSGHRIPTWRFS